MNTPIFDFVQNYIDTAPARLHMPGHKGVGFLGCEPWDITEIPGADSLYTADSVIRESERNAAGLFGAGDTLYSAEGSSLCIRAMLYLAVLAFREKRPGRRPTVIAGRNAHKSFLTAAALLDFDIHWLYSENPTYSLCRCEISGAQLEAALERVPDSAAVFVTSPDYLGHTVNIEALARTAHSRGVPLLVDNAHGAYQRFLHPSRHPMDQGADLCCDSAHKTLPVLTGGAYLHIGRAAQEIFSEIFFTRARGAMAMFGSTSPSYLILQSLDRANRYLAGDYPQRLAETVERLDGLKARLTSVGWALTGDEPLKLTLEAKSFGYTGSSLGERLEAQGIFCEYADPDYIVFMVTPENPRKNLLRLETALAAVERRPALPKDLPGLGTAEGCMSVREAMLSPCETVAVSGAAGRVLASLAAVCPPAVAPAVPGEVVSESAAAVYGYYGIRHVDVVLDG